MRRAMARGGVAVNGEAPAGGGDAPCGGRGAGIERRGEPASGVLGSRVDRVIGTGHCKSPNSQSRGYGKVSHNVRAHFCAGFRARLSHSDRAMQKVHTSRCPCLCVTNVAHMMRSARFAAISSTSTPKPRLGKTQRWKDLKESSPAARGLSSGGRDTETRCAPP